MSVKKWFVLAFPLAAAAIIPVAAQASVQAGAADRAGPATRLTWGRAEEVPGTAALPGGAPLFENQTTSISCSSAGNCEAAGYYSDIGTQLTQPFVARQVHGTWRKAQLIPGMRALSGQDKNFVYAEVLSISCASAGNCAVGGDYNDTVDDRLAFVADEVNGTWRKPVEVPGTAGLNTGNEAAIVSLSCPSAGNCAAGGMYSTSPGHTQAFVVNEVGGTWRQARIVPGSGILNQGEAASVTSAACSTAGNCTAAGFAVAPGLPIGPGGGSSGPERAFAVSQVRGTWHAAVEVRGLSVLDNNGSAQISAVSCSSPGTCSAVGTASDFHGHDYAFVLSEVGGRWGTAREVAAGLNDGGFAGLNTLSCTAGGRCSACGFYGADTHRHAFVISRS